MTATATTLVRLRSHRAAARLERLLGSDLDWYYTWADGGCFVVIPTGLLEQARQIPGITLARPSGELHKCGGW